MASDQSDGVQELLRLLEQAQSLADAMSMRFVGIRIAHALDELAKATGQSGNCSRPTD